MDDYNENLGILFLILFGFSFIVIGFLINYYHLSKFKKCYDKHFNESYCVKYKKY